MRALGFRRGGIGILPFGGCAGGEADTLQYWGCALLAAGERTWR